MSVEIAIASTQQGFPGTEFRAWSDCPSATQLFEVPIESKLLEITPRA